MCEFLSEVSRDDGGYLETRFSGSECRSPMSAMQHDARRLQQFLDRLRLTVAIPTFAIVHEPPCTGEFGKSVRPSSNFG